MDTKLILIPEHNILLFNKHIPKTNKNQKQNWPPIHPSHNSIRTNPTNERHCRPKIRPPNHLPLLLPSTICNIIHNPTTSQPKKEKNLIYISYLAEIYREERTHPYEKISNIYRHNPTITTNIHNSPQHHQRKHRKPSVRNSHGHRQRRQRPNPTNTTNSHPIIQLIRRTVRQAVVQNNPANPPPRQSNAHP